MTTKQLYKLAYAYWRLVAKHGCDNHIVIAWSKTSAVDFSAVDVYDLSDKLGRVSYLARDTIYQRNKVTTSDLWTINFTSSKADKILKRLHKRMYSKGVS